MPGSETKLLVLLVSRQSLSGQEYDPVHLAGGRCWLHSNSLTVSMAGFKLLNPVSSPLRRQTWLALLGALLSISHLIFCTYWFNMKSSCCFCLPDSFSYLVDQLSFRNYKDCHSHFHLLNQDLNPGSPTQPRILLTHRSSLVCPLILPLSYSGHLPLTFILESCSVSFCTQLGRLPLPSLHIALFCLFAFLFLLRWSYGCFEKETNFPKRR